MPVQELHRRAVSSVGGSNTAQSVKPQEEIPEEGRRKKIKKIIELYLFQMSVNIPDIYSCLLTFTYSLHLFSYINNKIVKFKEK